MPDIHRPRTAREGRLRPFCRRTQAAAVLIAFIGWTGSGCGATAPSGLPASVVLAPGESTQVGQARVQFDRVVSDSRCPINAMCVTAGDAVAAVSFSVGSARGSDELALVDPARRTITRGGVVLEFTGLSPHPFAGQPTTPGDYRATFALSAER